jgi:hypothetical protein
MSPFLDLLLFACETEAVYLMEGLILLMDEGSLQFDDL